MSDIVDEVKAVVKDNEQVENYLRTGMMPISFKRIKALMAKVERLLLSNMVKEIAIDEYVKKITTLKAENAEWVAKSHAWLTASMAQDEEITTLKASLEASEKRVRKWEVDFIKEDWRRS